MLTKKLGSSFDSAAQRAPRRAMPDFVPEKDTFDVLQTFVSSGFENVVLHGGALRDDYLRNILGYPAPTKDYDIVAEIDPAIFNGKTDFEDATAILREYIQKKFPGAQITAAGINFNKDGTFYGGADFTDASGRTIDLMLNEKGRHKSNVAERIKDHTDIVSGEGPLSRIAMDSNGVLCYDQNFEEHARQGIYMPDKPISDQWLEHAPRLRRMKTKIPGLQYVPPEQENAPIQILTQKKRRPNHDLQPSSTKTPHIPVM